VELTTIAYLGQIFLGDSFFALALFPFKVGKLDPLYKTIFDPKVITFLLLLEVKNLPLVQLIKG